MGQWVSAGAGQVVDFGLVGPGRAWPGQAALHVRYDQAAQLRAGRRMRLIPDAAGTGHEVRPAQATRSALRPCRQPSGHIARPDGPCGARKKMSSEKNE
ncbi:hypothetical protein R1flu_016581 [Riccia fluitans]|uniref:Uncharacterized protein n=1 Tax=Riccia fluitans TaxID=41844 RepID=A0ABD1YMF7_9MARC